MPQELQTIVQVYIKVGGSDLPEATMDQLMDVEVDVGFHMPGTATIRFYDAKLALVDDARFDPGKELEVAVKDSSSQSKVLFKGEIWSLAPEFEENAAYNVMTIVAYDKSFRLHRGRESKIYVQSTDSDTMQKLIQPCGLSPRVKSTSLVREHVYRHDQSDYEFLTALARRNGFVVFCDSPQGVLKVDEASAIATQTVDGEYGQQILSFRPHRALGGQVSEVSVGGWDAKRKASVIGQKTTPSGATSAGFTNRGPAAVVSSFSTATLHVTEALSAQGDAESLALAVLSRMAAGDVTAEATSLGKVELMPGAKLNVKKAGTRFSGNYVITRARHRIGQKESYQTDLWLGGMTSATLHSLLADDPRSADPPGKRIEGLITAIVTNNADPENQGRVKVKFPSIGDDLESEWARVVAPGAGKERGLMLIPEVNDEVLLGFANGDINYPYVLGGLWNGEDALPEPPVENGNVEIRELKTREGTTIRLTDKSGSEKIEIFDKGNKTTLTFDIANKTIEMKAEKDILIEAQGNVNIKGVEVNIEGTSEVSVKGPQVSANGDAKIELKGGMAELSASGMTKISGATVQVN